MRKKDVRKTGRPLRGFTLIEMVIYMFLMTLILGLVYSMAVVNRRQMERPAASFRIQQSLLAAHQLLKQDLKYTRLSTIRIYPNDSHPEEPPGIAMASPQDRNGNFTLSGQDGMLFWKTIYYTLEKIPDSPETGRLVRKEVYYSHIGVQVSQPYPYEPALDELPSKVRIPNKWNPVKVVCNCIYLPNTTITELSRTLDGAGGFKACFTDAAGSSRKRVYNALDELKLVEIELVAGEKSVTTGKLTMLNYRITVFPQFNM